MRARRETTVKPFLQVDSKLWRGPQPTPNDLSQLKHRGLRAVYNLREESGASRALALNAGLNYHHVPVEDWNVPALRQVQEFLDMLNLPEFSPGLIHCWGGVGRTGIFVSCYRVSQGMEMESAIQLSDQETPHLLMNELQRNWLRQHAHHFQSNSNSTGQWSEPSTSG